jgi:hypothetical protein
LLRGKKNERMSEINGNICGRQEKTTRNYRWNYKEEKAKSLKEIKKY